MRRLYGGKGGSTTDCISKVSSIICILLVIIPLLL